MGTYRYEGEVKRNKIVRPHGRGTLTCYANGGDSGPDDFLWKYEGEFEKGHATGQGKKTLGVPYPDDPDSAGWVYIGVHLDGEAHGLGTWYYQDRAKAYHGDNQKGLYHGHGTSYRHDGTIKEDGTREDGTREYEGSWQESYWKGNGILYRPDGSISREGEWVYGFSWEYKRQGETCWYEGDWNEEVCPHGWGILYRPDRITVEREGWWQNGEPVDGPPPNYPDAP